MSKEVLAEFYAKYKIFLYPATVGVASLILIIFVIIPQIGAFLEAQNSLQVSEAKLQTLEVKATDLEGLNGSDLNRKVDTTLTSLPSDKEFASLMGLIQSLAADSGMSLNSVALGQLQSPGSGVSGFIVKVEVIGPTSLLKNFLSSIEKAPRAMKVSGIEISSSQSSNVVDALVTLDVFFAPVPKTLGTIDQALPKITQDDEKLITDLSKASTAGISGTPALVPRGKVNPFE